VASWRRVVETCNAGEEGEWVCLYIWIERESSERSEVRRVPALPSRFLYLGICIRLLFFHISNLT
jgi:hypothetical protein